MTQQLQNKLLFAFLICFAVGAAFGYCVGVRDAGNYAISQMEETK